jgi:inner membrane protein
VLHRRDSSRLLTGILDESAHLLTASILVAALPLPRDELFLRGALAGAVLIDLDHLPGEFGSAALTRGNGRPLPHSLPTVAVLLACAAPLSTIARPLFLGAAVGVLTHFLRDIATGRLPLRWPHDRRRVTIPYGFYPALLALASLRVLGVGRSGGRAI